MTTPRTLLALLSSRRFRSGTEIAAELGVSRAAVCKSVRRLQELGVTVDAVPGRGYRLRNEIELLSLDEIRARAPGAISRIAEVFCLDEVDSTNHFLLQRARYENAASSLCVAERQTAGRGRRGRSWHSPFGANVYLSVLWTFNRPASELGALGLAVGVTTVLALEKLGIEGLGLKWPNDIYWNGRKLGGLLLELAACEALGPCRVVVGLGLNVNMPRSDTTSVIDQPWVDLAAIGKEGGRSRNHLIAVLLEQMIPALETFEAKGIAAFVSEWQRLDLAAGRNLELRLGDRTCRGLGRGIDDEGRLLMESDGRVDAFAAGEVSLRLSP